jgi:hypothetical protein
MLLAFSVLSRLKPRPKTGRPSGNYACKLGLCEVVSLIMNVAHVDLNTGLQEGCANGQLGIVKLLNPQQAFTKCWNL